jgi:hypothetical protein
MRHYSPAHFGRAFLLREFFLKIFCKTLDKYNKAYYICTINNAQNTHTMKNATITTTNIFAGASSFITTRAALERLGWDFSGMYITLDHIRIDENQEGSLSWSPCDEYGDNSRSGSESILSRDVAACLNDLATLAESGELQPL